MTVTLSAEQRDIVYDQVLIEMSGIGDVWLAVCTENFEAADRLGRQFCDELRLVIEDLGWGEGGKEPVELTAPPDVLRRVFTRLGRRAEQQAQADVRELGELEERRRSNRLVRETCAQVLGAIGSSGGR